MTVVATLDTTPELELDEKATLDRIRRYITHSPDNSRIFTMTPPICATLLDNYNLGNRPKKPYNIARYADDMQAGCWPLTGDTIKFSDAKKLRDGQNRLAACVRAGVPFQTHIVFGISDEAFDRLDQGRNRNGADVLAIAGYQNTTVLAGAVRWVNLIETGRGKNRDTFQPAETLRLLRERYQKLPDLIPQGRVIYENTGQPQSVVVAILYLINRANSQKGEEFAAAWESANWAGKYKSIGLMQSRLASIKASTSGRIHDVVRVALIIKAWNLYAAGRKGRSTEMTWEPSEVFPSVAGLAS